MKAQSVKFSKVGLRLMLFVKKQVFLITVVVPLKNVVCKHKNEVFMSTYTYLLGSEGQAVLIDPVWEHVRRDGALLRCMTGHAGMILDMVVGVAPEGHGGAPGAPAIHAYTAGDDGVVRAFACT